MALIKNANASTIAREAIVLDLGDLQRQGAAIIEQARTQAESIIAEALRERERILAGAGEVGHAAGLARGIEEGRKIGVEKAREEALQARQRDLTSLIESWTGALKQFSARRADLIQSAERDVIRLATLVADKVIKRRLELDPGLVVEQVRAVLGVVVRPTELVLAVHPEDRQLVDEALGPLLAEFPVIRSVSLREDPALARGSCVGRMRDPESRLGETGGGGVGGEVDASIATQVDRIVAALLPSAEAQETSGVRSDRAGA